METAILTLAFATTTAVSVCVVLAFSVPIDGVLDGLLSGALAQGWSRCVKFALFVASFTGGLRLGELGGVIAAKAPGMGAPGAPGLTVDQGMLEVFKSITAALGASSWTLLAFFGAALGVHAAIRVSEAFKASSAQSRAIERPQHSGVSSGRL